MGAKRTLMHSLTDWYADTGGEAVVPLATTQNFSLTDSSAETDGKAVEIPPPESSLGNY